MKTRLLAASLCALALTACDFEKRPDSAPDQGGAGATRSTPGSAPMAPATPGGSETSPGTTPAGGGTSTR